LGFYTICIDKNPNAVGFKYCDEYKIIDIIDEEQSLKFAKSKNIDGVLTAATDYGVLSTAYIANKLRLKGVNYEVAKVVKDKFKVRRNLLEKNVDDIKQCYKLEKIGDLEKYKNILFPVIVKPIDGSGSKGVSKVDSFKALQDACKHALKQSKCGFCMIEDYIEGKEYGVELYVDDKSVNVLGIIDKKMRQQPYYAELGHDFPSELNVDIKRKLRNTVINAINALGINFGPVNMDVLISNENRINIIDIGVRMGGNLIGSHIIPIGLNIKYLDIIINSTMGKEYNRITPQEHRDISTRLIALSPGLIKTLPSFDIIEKRYDVKIYTFLKRKQEIREYKNNLDGVGYIVSKSKGIDKNILDAEAALKELDNSIERYDR